LDDIPVVVYTNRNISRTFITTFIIRLSFSGQLGNFYTQAIVSVSRYFNIIVMGRSPFNTCSKRSYKNIQQNFGELSACSCFFLFRRGVGGHKKGNSDIFFLTVFKKHSTIE